MSDNVYSHAGVTLQVSASVENDDLTQSGFEALSYTPISNMGALGEYGINTNFLTYDTMDTNVARKAKGITDLGNPPVEVARTDNDAGQIAMRVIGAPQYFNSHAFKLTKQDGAIEFMRALVSGPVSPSGRNEDFDLHTYVLSINQFLRYVDIGGLAWIFDTGFLAGAPAIITADGVIPA